MTITEIANRARSIRDGIDSLAEQHQSFCQQVTAELDRLELEIAAARYPGLHLSALLEPLCGERDANHQSWAPSSVFLAGAGPWERDTLAQFLSSCGFEIVETPANDAAIVLGSLGLDEQVVKVLVELDRNGRLFLFSQELFVLGMIRHCDPYELIDDEPVEQIADSHSSIQTLLQAGVHWPSSPAWTGGDEEHGGLSGGDIDVSGYENYEWQSQSVLSKLGYSAKAGALTLTERRGALDRAVSADLRGIASADELDRFGPPSHTRRLAALVYLMLWLNRFQSADKPDAQKRRLADLHWLQSRYDPDRTRFRWPDLGEARARGMAVAAKRVPDAAFTVPLTPDPQLAAIVGSVPLPRTEIVSKLWAYIKKHKLQDSVDKRMVNADSKLIALFGKPQVSMFEMAGLIGKHVR